MIGSPVTLVVGQYFHLKRGKDRIVYAGMPTDDVYSIVQLKTAGYRGYAWNLYFPTRKREITVDGVDLYVESVSPEGLTLRLL